MMSRLLTRREQMVLGFIALSVIVGSITIFALRGDRSDPEPIMVETLERATPPSAVQVAPPQPDPEPAPPEIIVSIQGAVRKPGVYRLDATRRVQDLIQAAGGLALDADTGDINLAARLIDGTTLTVPSRVEPGSAELAAVSSPKNPDAYTVSRQLSGALSASSPAGAPRRINLNTATQAELETLPGIGPKLAQQIIQYRSVQPFRDVSELDDVSGIGTAKLESVRDLVTVE